MESESELEEDSDAEQQQKQQSPEEIKEKDKIRTESTGHAASECGTERTTSVVSDGGTTMKRSTKTKKGEKTAVLSGATITAYATSIFQRLRAIDEINFDQIYASLNPRSNRD